MPCAPRPALHTRTLPAVLDRGDVTPLTEGDPHHHRLAGGGAEAQNRRHCSVSLLCGTVPVRHEGRKLSCRANTRTVSHTSRPQRAARGTRTTPAWRAAVRQRKTKGDAVCPAVWHNTGAT